MSKNLRTFAIAALLVVTWRLGVADVIDGGLGPVTRVNSLGFVQSDGVASRTVSGSLPESRFMGYVISQDYGSWATMNKEARALAEYRTFAVDREFKVGSKNAFQHVRAVDLTTGYAYTKIGDTPLATTSAEFATFAFEHAEFFMPLVAQNIVRFLPRFRDRLPEIRRELRAAADEIAANPWMQSAIEDLTQESCWVAPADLPKDLELVIQEARSRYTGARLSDDLVNELLKASVDVEGRFTKVVAAMATVAAVYDGGEDLATITGLFFYPFIISRRTVGGSEGTEVVVYAKEHSTNSATVYYLYVHSPTTKNIEVGGFKLVAGVPAAVLDEVEKCGYAKIPLVWETYDGEANWYIDGTTGITKGEIADLAPDASGGFETRTPEQIELYTILQRAHEDACLAGIGPTAIDCGDVDLVCP